MEKKAKTERTRERILTSAIEMFGEVGYGGWHINEFCRSYNISKGILYHNFSGKDELYLLSVERCFSALVDFIQESGEIVNIQEYLRTRLRFFQQHRAYGRLFFEATLRPPEGLAEEVRKVQRDLWLFNRGIFEKLLSAIELRQGVLLEDALEYFDIVQEGFNRKFRLEASMTGDIEAIVRSHEEKIELLIDCILYGVSAKK